MAGTRKKAETDGLELENPGLENGAQPVQEADPAAELSIEEMFERLDGIMRTLEDSRSTLEESFASYEAGMRLVRACSEKIDKVEKQIMVVNGEETEA